MSCMEPEHSAERTTCTHEASWSLERTSLVLPRSVGSTPAETGTPATTHRHSSASCILLGRQLSRLPPAFFQTIPSLPKRQRQATEGLAGVPYLMHFSSTSTLIVLSRLATPTLSQKSRKALAGTPRLLKPDNVGKRGSSQPCTQFSVTRARSFLKQKQRTDKSDRTCDGTDTRWWCSRALQKGPLLRREETAHSDECRRTSRRPPT